MSKIQNIIGIGFGPANIALAALLDETGDYPKHLFLEESDSPVWQGEMLFENALDIHSNVQNIPHRDLATLRSPRSRYTFMNYLHENDLLLEHLNMDMMMPMRPDYAAYIKWVAEQLSGSVRTGSAVKSIEVLDDVHSNVYKVKTSGGEEHYARHIVIGTGRPANIPDEFRSVVGSNRVVHLSEFKSSIEKLIASGAQKIAVIGSSQSAVEIVLNLSKHDPKIEIDSIFRRFGYPLKDTNPFMSEIFFPEFTDLYFNANRALKRTIDRDVIRTNYGACDMDVLEELYRQIYYDKLHGKNTINVIKMTTIKSAIEVDSAIELLLEHSDKGESTTRKYDVVVLATGFQNIGGGSSDVKIPNLLSTMEEHLALDKNGCVQVNRDYQVALNSEFGSAGKIVLNGLCESTHGMGDAGSLSLLSLRAKTILEALDLHDTKESETDTGQVEKNRAVA